MEQKALFIVNPRAGKMKFRNDLFESISMLGAAGYTTSVHATQERGDAMRLAAELGGGVDLVVCCGGDGTLNEVINGMMALETPPLLGYLPAGTTNDFATGLHLPHGIIPATEIALSGQASKIDIGLFNQRYFSYIASFGAFTEASYSASQSAKNLLGHVAYLLEGAKDIANIRSTHIRIETPRMSLEDDFIFGAVSNATSIAGLLKLSADQVRFNDGVFEVILIRAPQNLLEVQRVVSSMLKKKFNDELITFFHTDEITFQTVNEMQWSLDGEQAEGPRRTVITNCHNRLKIMLPQQTAMQLEQSKIES